MTSWKDTLATEAFNGLLALTCLVVGAGVVWLVGGRPALDLPVQLVGVDISIGFLQLIGFFALCGVAGVVGALWSWLS